MPRLNTPLWSPAPDLSPLSVQGQCRCPGCTAVRYSKPKDGNAKVSVDHALGCVFYKDVCGALEFTHKTGEYMFTPQKVLGRVPSTRMFIPHKVLGRAPSTRMFIPHKCLGRAPSTRMFMPHKVHSHTCARRGGGERACDVWCDIGYRFAKQGSMARTPD